MAIFVFLFFALFVCVYAFCVTCMLQVLQSECWSLFFPAPPVSASSVSPPEVSVSPGNWPLHLSINHTKQPIKHIEEQGKDQPKAQWVSVHNQTLLHICTGHNFLTNSEKFQKITCIVCYYVLYYLSVCVCINVCTHRGDRRC